MTLKKDEPIPAPSSSSVENRRFQDALGKVLKVTHKDMQELLKNRKVNDSVDHDSPASS